MDTVKRIFKDKFNFYTFFKSRKPIDIADLIAVRLYDGRYFLYKTRYLVNQIDFKKEIVDEEFFMNLILPQCKTPIVLHESYMEEGFMTDF